MYTATATNDTLFTFLMIGTLTLITLLIMAVGARLAGKWYYKETGRSLPEGTIMNLILGMVTLGAVIPIFIILLVKPKEGNFFWEMIGLSIGIAILLAFAAMFVKGTQPSEHERQDE